MKGTSDEGRMSEETPTAKKSYLKLIIIAVVALLVLGGGGVGAWLFMKKRAAAKVAAEKAQAEQAAAPHGPGEAPPKEEADTDECEDTGAKKEGAGEAPPVMVLTRTVNLSGPRRYAFLRCEFNILFCDPELGKLVAGDKPSAQKSIIQATVLAALSGKTVDEASDAESRDSLRKEIKDKLNEQFRPHALKPGEKEDPKHKRITRPIKSVLIVDWAIQQ